MDIENELKKFLKSKNSITVNLFYSIYNLYLDWYSEFHINNCNKKIIVIQLYKVLREDKFYFNYESIPNNLVVFNDQHSMLIHTKEQLSHFKNLFEKFENLKEFM